jgi:hypothetical protein
VATGRTIISSSGRRLHYSPVINLRKPEIAGRWRTMTGDVIGSAPHRQVPAERARRRHWSLRDDQACEDLVDFGDERVEVSRLC